jgi:hypothetical protein
MLPHVAFITSRERFLRIHLSEILLCALLPTALYRSEISVIRRAFDKSFDISERKS